MRVVTGLLGACLAIYAGLCALLYFAQHGLLYHPTPDVAHDGAEALRLTHEGEVLKIWKAGSGVHAVIYFGGNAEDVARSIPRFSTLDDTTAYLVNYRGYGGSTGTPSEAAIYRDAAFVFDYVAARHDDVAVIGRSLGSGVAVWLAAERPFARLVLVTPYDSVENVAQGAYPFMPVSLLIRERYASIERVAAIEEPTLILAAEHDAVIPRNSTMALAAAFGRGRVQVLSIDGTTHNTIGRSPRYMQEIARFLGGAQR